MSGLLSWLVGASAPASHVTTARRISASTFDIARTSEHNEKHWLYATPQNAIDAISPDARRIASARARYESRNNSWLAGIVRTKANDTIGTGPRLQLMTADRALNQRLEKAWSRWARMSRLALKLRTAMIAKIVDGEVFATFANNGTLRSPIILDLRLINSSRISSGIASKLDSNELDGIVFDEDFNPKSYLVEDLSPNSVSALAKRRPIDASRVCHWYRPESPEQIRGISELAPSLGLFADLRRFRAATLAAAETAADYAGVLYTDMPPNQAAEAADAFDAVELEARSLLTIPAGWKMDQLEAKHPGPAHREFIEISMNEAARCVLIPKNVALGNSGGYNFASGRLDFITYYREIALERDDCEGAILDRLLMEFVREAAADPALGLPKSMRDALDVPHKWFWPGLTHADPLKEAQAARLRLESRLTTLSREYAEEGLDWYEEIAQTEVEEKELASRGVSRFAEVAATSPIDPQTDTNNEEDPADAAA